MSPKILIVDDESHIWMLIEQTLEELEDEGVDLLFADNGAEAFQTIQREEPNLVFLDVMMPKMNGIEVCRKVKENPGMEKVHIILLTAKGQEADKSKGMEVGADRYMTKPFDPDELLEIAREVIAKE
jgi:DNA-binding response OmpR family regulator